MPKPNNQFLAQAVVSSDELLQIKSLAKKLGLTTSNFIRMKLNLPTNDKPGGYRDGHQFRSQKTTSAVNQVNPEKV